MFGRGKQENGKWATLMRREQESFEMDNDVPFLIGTFAVSLVVVTYEKYSTFDILRTSER